MGGGATAQPWEFKGAFVNYSVEVNSSNPSNLTHAFYEVTSVSDQNLSFSLEEKIWKGSDLIFSQVTQSDVKQNNPLLQNSFPALNENELKQLGNDTLPIPLGLGLVGNPNISIQKTILSVMGHSRSAFQIVLNDSSLNFNPFEMKLWYDEETGVFLKSVSISAPISLEHNATYFTETLGSTNIFNPPSAFPALFIIPVSISSASVLGLLLIYWFRRKK